MQKIVIVGASGMVGSAAVRHFAAQKDWQVVGVSRRYPVNLDPALASRFTHLPLDLTDKAACEAAFGNMQDATHLVYAAVHEQPGDVVSGWRAREQMQTNRSMLVNVMEPLDRAASGLSQVSLLQGTKAYGFHIDWPDKAIATPNRESDPRHPHENFYWLQQDYITEKQASRPWSWTIWRPQLIFGDPVGSNLSVISVIGAYAALERAAGRGLSYPGGPAFPLEIVDADLIAEAIDWATASPAARNQVFNITNGDVIVWQNVWPMIAESFGMRVDPPRPQSLLQNLNGREAEWAALVDRYQLASSRSLKAFIGGSAALADFMFAYGVEHTPPPALVSTIKLRQAGFGGCIDSEVMLRKWITRLQELRYVP
ncbi:MAG: SDR family oxidoreductase, partial [Nevskia sp.]|nr:SDR family oxidoreductase [Nevskia sp.]